MDLITKYFPAIKLGVAIPLLSGCSAPGAVDDPPKYTINGTVMAPNGLLALMQEETIIAKMLSSVFSDASAMVVGDLPVGNATVELLPMYDDGFEKPVYGERDTETTNTNGEFSITTTEVPPSNLKLRVRGDNGVWMHALVVSENTDVDVVSEYVYSSVMQSVHSDPEVFLPYFSAFEIENLLASIEILDVDLTNASSIDAAINEISAADAGALQNLVAMASSPNLDGDWLYVKKSGSNSCGNPVGVELIRTELVVSQMNDALTIFIDGSVFSTGTLFGREVVGLRLETYPENGGTMVQSSSTMTVASDNQSVDGSISWDWFGVLESCSGSDIVSVSRI